MRCWRPGGRAARLAVAAAGLAVVAAGCAASGSGSAANTLPRRTADPALVSKAALAPCPATGAGKVDGGLPELRLPCLAGGSSVDLAGLRGPALVNLWWSGCEPCRKEAPLLQRLSVAGKGRLTVLGIDVEDPDAGLRFAVAYGLHYPMASDPHEQVKDAGMLRAFPTTYFVDRTGRVVSSGPQVFTSLAGLRTAVRHQLGVSVP